MKARIATALAGLFTGSLQAELTKVYLGTPGQGDSKGIYLCLLDTETGSLSEPKLAAEIGGAGFLAIHPSGKYVYSTARAEGNEVAAFRVETEGNLTLLNRQASEGNGPCHVSVDATGSCVLVANYGSGSVAALKIDEDGSLVKSGSAHQHKGSGPNKARQEAPHAHSIYPGPENRFAYAPDLGSDRVMIYRLQPETATLTPAGEASVPPGSGPRHMKFGKNGEQAYVLNELTLTVAVFDRVAEDGMLKEKQVADCLDEGIDREGMTCSEIRVHPNGRFVYTANRDTADRGRDSLTTFRVAEGGRLERIQTIPAGVAIPRNIGVDPDGKWLLVAGQKSGNVPVFRIGDDGRLTPNGNEVRVANAMCVEFLKEVK